MTSAHTNGHRRARVDHPVPLVAEALTGLLAAAGYIVATDSHARADLVVTRSGRPTPANAPTIVIVDADDTAGRRAAIANDVAGMIASNAPVEDFRACIDAVGAGEHWRNPELIDAGPVGPALTRRERDVAALVATGQRNRTIAASLGISEGTVKMHLHNVYAKLGLESRTQLAMDVRARS